MPRAAERCWHEHPARVCLPGAWGYMDVGDRFDDAVAEWAVAYADVVQKDFETLEAAVISSRLPSEWGV